MEADIFDFLASVPKINKVYLSNVNIFEGNREFYSSLSLLSKSGLIYLDLDNPEILIGLDLEERLTKRAKDLKRRLNPNWNWKPCIFVKQ